MTDTAGIPGDRIRSFIERVERIDEEIKGEGVDFRQDSDPGFPLRTDPAG